MYLFVLCDTVNLLTSRLGSCHVNGKLIVDRSIENMNNGVTPYRMSLVGYVSSKKIKRYNKHLILTRLVWNVV